MKKNLEKEKKPKKIDSGRLTEIYGGIQWPAMNVYALLQGIIIGEDLPFFHNINQ